MIENGDKKSNTDSAVMETSHEPEKAIITTAERNVNGLTDTSMAPLAYRRIVMEPSGATEQDDPLLDPPHVVHLFGTGQLFVDSAGSEVMGGFCTFGTCIEALLLALEVPFVVHIMDWRQKPKWYLNKFTQSYTPAIFFNGRFMQETKDIIRVILDAYRDQAQVKGVFPSATDVYASYLPETYTPLSSMMAVYNYLNYSPCDLGSAAYAEATTVSGSSDDSKTSVAMAAIMDPASARQAALDACLAELSPLEAVLSRHPCCCGDSFGVADIVHFCLLQTLLDLIGPIWGLSEPVLSRTPHICNWMYRMRRQSWNPFNSRGGYNAWHWLQVAGPLWVGKLKNRCFEINATLEKRLMKVPIYQCTNITTAVIENGDKKSNTVGAVMETSQEAEKAILTAAEKIIDLRDSGKHFPHAHIGLIERDAVSISNDASALDDISTPVYEGVSTRSSEDDSEGTEDDSVLGDMREALRSTRPQSIENIPSGTKFKRSPLHQTNFNDPYWFLLDLSLKALLAVLIALYAILILVGAIFTVIFVNPQTDFVFSTIDGLTLSNFTIAFMNSAVCIITSSAGEFQPSTTGAHWVNLVLQFVGVIYNALIFTVIVTRFQHPQSELIFSSVACTGTRNGVNILKFRIGNKRCNYIFQPRVDVYLVSSERTAEGETYIQTTPIPLLNTPPVISGSFNIVAEIAEGSRLDVLTRIAAGERASDLIKHGQSDTDFHLLVLMTGVDDTYTSEIRCFHRYYISDIRIGQEFADIIKTKNDKHFVDWQYFHHTKETKRVRHFVSLIAEPSGMFAHENPVVLPDTMIHLFGLMQYACVDDLKHTYAFTAAPSTHSSQDSERIREVGVGGGCPFTVACEFMLSEMRIPYVLHGIEEMRLPAWHRRMFGVQAQSPATPVAFCPKPNSAAHSSGYSERPPTADDLLSKAISKDRFCHGAELILQNALKLYPSQSCKHRLPGAIAPRPSGISSLTSSNCFAAALKYLNADPCDEGSLSFSEGCALPINEQTKANALDAACRLCAEELRPLEDHLSEFKYCCGLEPGIDDFVRFTLLMFAFDILAPLWGLQSAIYEQCPHIRKWMRRMGCRPTNPYYGLYVDGAIYSVLSGGLTGADDDASQSNEKDTAAAGHVADSIDFHENKKRYYSANDFVFAFGSEWRDKLPNRSFVNIAMNIRRSAAGVDDSTNFNVMLNSRTQDAFSDKRSAGGSVRGNNSLKTASAKTEFKVQQSTIMSHACV